MEIAVDKCRCCQCWELTFLDQGCVKVTDRKMYMYGHFDRKVGDILKITTKAPLADEINSCWEITAGPPDDIVYCDPGTVQSERGVHVANCADHCPDVAIPILGCWVIESCSGLGTKTVSTDLSAYNLGDVLNLADSGVDCWEIIEQVPCPEDEPKWIIDPGPALASCTDCVPPPSCCTCGNCDYAKTSNESADIWNIGWANSYLGFQRHIFNSATSQQPEILRHKPNELLKLYTCNKHGAVWRGKAEIWLLRSDIGDLELSEEELDSLSCPGPMITVDGVGDPILFENQLVNFNSRLLILDKTETLVSVRKDCDDGGLWKFKLDEPKLIYDEKGWDKGYPTNSASIDQVFFDIYQSTESDPTDEDDWLPTHNDIFYVKDQSGAPILKPYRDDMCCGGEIKYVQNCPANYPAKTLYWKGTIDVYGSQCGCDERSEEMPSVTSTSVDSTKVFLDVSPP